MRTWIVLIGLACSLGITHAGPPSDDVCLLVTQCADTPGADRAKCLKGYGVATGDAKKCQAVSDAMLSEGAKNQMQKRQPGRAHGREKQP